MQKFFLELLVNAKELKLIKSAGLKIALARVIKYQVNVVNDVGELPINLIWLVINPFENNQVEWRNQYSIYASQQVQLTQGAMVSLMSQTSFPASDGAIYTFNPSATFNGPSVNPNAPAVGSYKINNQMPRNRFAALTFGLGQKASVNGKNIPLSPVNAQVVLANFPVVFTPTETIYVWLQNPLKSSTIITRLPQNFTKVRFDRNSTRKRLQYNPSTGKFI